MPGKQWIEGDRNNPQSMAVKMEKFLEWMKFHDYSEMTLETWEPMLGRFSRWCLDRGITQPQEVTLPVLERYLRQVFLSRKKDGQPLSHGTREMRVFPVKVFFRWLAKTHQLLYNPAADLELPRRGLRLPRHVFSIPEVEQVLNQVDMNHPMALRDRAMLELFYSTGIRRSELSKLKVQDIDLNRGWVMIVQGKNKKDRMVPVGERAQAWLEKYIWQLRPELLWRPGEDILFLTRDGKPLRPKHLTRLAHEFVIKAGLGKTGACHIFRHTMATLMLEGGADIRYLQEMLGHSRLDTTQIYTKVAIAKLKEVHEKTHPGAQLKPKKTNLPVPSLQLLPERSNPESKG